MAGTELKLLRFVEMEVRVGYTAEADLLRGG